MTGMEQNSQNKDRKLGIMKQLILEKYGIKILKMEKTKFGTADCYIAYGGSDKYFLKIYQSKYNRSQISKEIHICQLLLREQICVSEYMDDRAGSFINDSPYGVFTLQKYISGITYDKFCVPSRIICQSAEILGKINQAIENEDGLKTDFPVSWIKNANADADMAKLEDMVHMAEGLPSGSYKKRIIEDCKWKLSIMPEIANNRSSYYQLTRKNSHGDYNTYQWICENESIKCIVDFGSCGNIPIIWELIRSFTYASPECINRNSINIMAYTEYLKRYLRVNHLKMDDFCYGFSFYLFSLLPSVYGYKEYINDLKKGSPNDIIHFAFWRTDMCRLLYQTANKLDFNVCKKIGGSGLM